VEDDALKSGDGISRWRVRSRGETFIGGGEEPEESSREIEREGRGRRMWLAEEIVHGENS
jgi:hypothetical protein